jgi:glycine/D-amino acid oxidase-like deaminating enzyme
VPDVKRSLIPARPYQVATQPLDESVRARILPGRNPVTDLHYHPFAIRWSPDNRLVTGGLGVFNDRGAVARMAGYFLRRLHKYLPGLPSLKATHAWDGVVATTPDLLPEIWTLGRGLYAPIGCNGRGIALTTTMGHSLAAFVATGNRAALPVTIGPPRQRSFHPILELGPSFWLAWNRLKDWNDDRRAN